MRAFVFIKTSIALFTASNHASTCKRRYQSSACFLSLCEYLSALITQKVERDCCNCQPQKDQIAFSIKSNSFSVQDSKKRLVANPRSPQSSPGFITIDLNGIWRAFDSQRDGVSHWRLSWRHPPKDSCLCGPAKDNGSQQGEPCVERRYCWRMDLACSLWRSIQGMFMFFLRLLLF